MSQRLRLRNVCFTLNNYSEEDLNKLKSLECKYIVIGKEIGKSKTKHLQGYIEFYNQKDFSWLKKFNERIHWEKRYGTSKQASDYCKKEDKEAFEKGTISRPGSRTDLQEAYKEIEESNKIRNVIATRPNHQVIKTMKEYLTYSEKGRTDKPNVIWIYGPTGIGKTKLAHELIEGDVYIKDETKWWEGYDNHETCIIDDFRGSQMKLTNLLRLLDRYENRVEIKGGSRQFKCKKIIITSIKSPYDVYNFGEEPIKQLIRRLDQIIELPQKNASEVKGNTIYLDPFKIFTNKWYSEEKPSEEDATFQEEHLEPINLNGQNQEKEWEHQEKDL